jgi:hypothetical protein
MRQHRPDDLKLHPVAIRQRRIGIAKLVLVPTSAQPPASARSRGRDGSRGDPNHRHPTAARQHADLGVTSVYLRGIDNTEIIDTVHERRAPMMSASAGLRIGP